jgi:hypothetical protein
MCKVSCLPVRPRKYLTPVALDVSRQSMYVPFCHLSTIAHVGCDGSVGPTIKKQRGLFIRQFAFPPHSDAVLT